MLRRVFLYNFVNFLDPTTVEFKENESPYIFVGENGSGKSSFLEGIRRCLPLSASTTRSTVFDKEKPGFYICKFSTANISPSDLKDLSDYKCIFTGIVTKFEGNNHIYYKFISTEGELMIEKHCDTEKCCDTGKCFQYSNSENAWIFFDCLDKNPEECFEKIVTIDFSEIKASDNSLDQKLHVLRKYVILTFPLRSIGPLQWSKSEKIALELRQNNYLEAGKRAEIIRYFLDNPAEFDLDAEQAIFRDLTSNIGIEFQLNTSADASTIFVRSTENSVLPGAEYSLLKLPEGILEAKHFSVLMSHKTFCTVMLEEPDRGMHPQMIQRMLAIIQKYSEKKLVILTTHNTCLVNPFTITRLAIFKKIKKTKDAKEHTEIVLGTEVANIKVPPEPTVSPGDEEEYRMKTLRILTHDHIADVIFARRILFCEGDSDFLFLTALKEKIMKGSVGIKHVLELVNQGKYERELKEAINNDLENLQRVCISLQIMSINGWNNAQLMHRTCNVLKLHCHYFVCDKDAVITGNDNAFDIKKDYNDWLEAPFKNICKDFQNKILKKMPEVRDRLRKDCNLFSWKDGTIEDMIMSLLDKNSDMPLPSGASDTSPSIPQYDDQVSWNEEIVDKLKRLHIDFPLESYKMRRRNRQNKTVKLYLSPKVTQEDVMESMEIFLGLCKYRSDLVQFIKFLLHMDDS